MITKVIMSIFKKPFTKDYPKKKSKISVNYRGVIHVDQEKCIACRLCEINCPTNAIVVDKEKKYAVVDRSLCISCGLCSEVCPVNAIWFSNDCETARKDKKDFKKQLSGPNPNKGEK